ncbi:MAG: porphobilinogen synthase [Chitinivibrionales bacterium]|nr:porphobilinogen synthase [Chitinivibrionales bacterium]
MQFPLVRKRRLRRNKTIRRMVRETKLSVDDLVAPLFIVPGSQVKRPISSMPEQYHFSVDTAVRECGELADLDIPAVILFGIPESKDPAGSHAIKEDGIIQNAVREIKKAVPGLVVITDVCLCEYTSHGHCGVLKEKDVDNDATLELLAKMAISHAEAGADIVAPSDMMDGRVGAIREALDSRGFEDVSLMSYAAKYASAYYGPFREAADSAPEFGDRRTYQMDPANAREALHEVQLDESEGADIVMVKPALAYLDIIRTIRDHTLLPVAAYNVSGEYSMIMHAAQKGLIDGDRVMMETLTSIKRAGAEIILTYFARRVGRMGNKKIEDYSQRVLNESEND